jgi:hypothetical protein
MPIAANEDGLFLLDDASTDNGTKISSVFELVTTDFGVPNPKRIRAAYVGYETSGTIVLKIKTDDENESVHILKARKTRQFQHAAFFPCGRDQKGTFWFLRIENRDGCDFSVDSIGLTLMVLGPRR